MTIEQLSNQDDNSKEKTDKPVVLVADLLAYKLSAGMDDNSMKIRCFNLASDLVRIVNNNPETSDDQLLSLVKNTVGYLSFSSNVTISDDSILKMINEAKDQFSIINKNKF